MKKFSRWKLYKARAMRDLSCRDLAVMVETQCEVNIAPSTISRWENGDGMPRIDLFLAVCAALDYVPDDLLDDE